MSLSTLGEVIQPFRVVLDVAFGSEQIHQFDLLCVAEFHFQSIDIEFHFHVDLLIVYSGVYAATQQEGGREQKECSLHEMF